MEHDRLSRVRVGSVDFLEHPAIASYLDAREHEAYYRSLKQVGPCREFHPRLVSFLERFLHESTRSEDQQVITNLIEAELTRQNRSYPAHSLVDEARTRYPQGSGLLQLTEPLSFDILKARYRAAALKHHPDRGGSHDAMIQLNEAYAYCHELLRQDRLRPEESLDEFNEEDFSSYPEVRDYQDFRFVVGELLFSVALDEWNLDEAVLLLKQITSDEWYRWLHSQDSGQPIDLVVSAVTLAERLDAAGLNSEAHVAVGIAKAQAKIGQSKGLSYGSYLRDAEQSLGGGRKLRIVLNHRRQADNALRLGLIDEKRYHKTIERLAAGEDKQNAKERAYCDYQRQHGLIQELPTDRIPDGKVSGKQLVPEPEYWTNIDDLSDEQQAEYKRAFSVQGTYRLVQGYARVRLDSLLRSVALHPDEIDLVAARREATLFSEICPPSVSWGGELVARAAQFMSSLQSGERQERVKLLRALHECPPSGSEFSGITITRGDGCSPFAIFVNDASLDLIMRPIRDLGVALRRGQLPETEEQKLDRDRWNRDLEALETPGIKASQKAAFAAVDYTSSNPTRAAQVILEHTRELLALGDTIRHVQELQVGYWIDRLTIALVKLKRWSEAREWIERFFSLPERYRKRSSPSEQKALRKRLKRCLKMGGSRP